MNGQANSGGESGTDSANPILTMQIVAAALMMGVATFGVIAFVITQGKQPTEAMISYVAVGFAALMALARSFIPSIISRQQVDQLAKSGSASASAAGSRTEQLYAVYQTSMIIGMAMLEGAAFLCLVAYILEVQVVAVAAAGVLLLLMAISFPTRTRVEHWVEEQQQVMDLST